MGEDRKLLMENREQLTANSTAIPQLRVDKGFLSGGKQNL